MYACFMKNGTSFDNTLMFLASPQLRYEMSQIHMRHPVDYLVNSKIFYDNKNFHLKWPTEYLYHYRIP